jgi:hypothetical protein
MKDNSIKKIEKIYKIPLKELWSLEPDFTKWLEDNVDYLNDVLGFDINILKREEKVGPFRVDLFAEDGFGNKLIIENQIEKTNHDHLGKVLTYLTNLEAKTAIWITSEPVEEHIKAIDWLNETTPDDISFYLIKLEAIRIGENSSASPLFTTIKKPTEERKQLGAEKKEYAEGNLLREKFWTQFLEQSNKRNRLLSNISPSRGNWISAGIGMAGVVMSFVVSKNYARVEIWINKGSKEENKNIFDLLYKMKNKIEKDFGDKLVWERMEDNITSRIKYQKDGLNISKEDDWQKMNNFMIENSEKMHKIFKEAIGKIKNKIK